MKSNTFSAIIDELDSIEKDENIPKTIKIKIKSAIFSLNNENVCVSLRVDKSLEELGSIAEDPNVPNYAKTQILSLVSLLESGE